MKSITSKLVLAFIFVSLVSILLVAFITGYMTNREFRSYVTNENQANFSAILSEYYSGHGSWEGLPSALGPTGMRYPMGMAGAEHSMMTLVDTSGVVIIASSGFFPGQSVDSEIIKKGYSLYDNGRLIGTLVLGSPGYLINSGGMEFLSRVRRSLFFGGLTVMLLALILGVFLSRTLTKPILELTSAMRSISSGNMDHKIQVRSRDELGELTNSFNRMNSELAHSLNLRKQMTADIAHELRTPISIILGHADAIHDGVLPPNKENFEIIREEADRLNGLVDDLRTLSLADAGELSLDKEMVSVSELLEETRLSHLQLARQKEITIEVSAKENLPEANLDPRRILQVLNNLLSNAINFTPVGGKVVLSAQIEYENVKINVADNGSGIVEEDLPHIFDRFYRSDPSRQRNQNGSGLGLAIAKSFVERHGGTIRVESILHRGTAFTIDLPLHN
jgi:two-component system sensor histidine kinase BaeS